MAIVGRNYLKIIVKSNYCLLSVVYLLLLTVGSTSPASIPGTGGYQWNPGVPPAGGSAYGQRPGQHQDVADNAGKEFVLMFSENTVDVPRGLPLELYVTTKKTSPVSGNCSAPRWREPGMPGGEIFQRFQVQEGFAQDIPLPPTLRVIGSTTECKGVLVQASDEVVVYGINKDTFSNDGFLALPVNVLGRRYFAVTYYPPTMRCQIGIVAVTDNTKVTFTFPRYKPTSGEEPVAVVYEGKTYRSGDVLTVNLNRLDAFQAQSRGDLTGTLIEATNPIAVFSGNVRTYVGDSSKPIVERSRDHLVEQLFPVESWGRTFATVAIPGRTTGDYFKFVAAEDDTIFTISGFGTHTLEKAGDHCQILIPSRTQTFIESNKPLQIVQIVASQTSETSRETADPSMILQVPVELFSYDYTLATPTYAGLTVGGEGTGEYQNELMLVIDRSTRDGLRVDGQTLSDSNWYYYPNSVYAATNVTLMGGPNKFHTVQHVNPTVVFGCYLYGHADRESYGFPCGARLTQINQPCSPCQMVVSDGVDNDCDRRIDEEICNDGVDNDMDGLMDEDCVTVYIPPATTPTPVLTTPTPTTTQAPSASASPTPATSKPPARRAPPDQFGQQFVLLFLENGVEGVQTEELRINIATAENAPIVVYCRVVSEKWNSPRLDAAFTLTQSQGYTVRVNPVFQMVGNTRSTKGILISCTHDVTVIAEQSESQSSDSFLVIPVDALDNEYIVTCYATPSSRCQFGIVAAFDDTKVTVEFASNAQVSAVQANMMSNEPPGSIHGGGVLTKSNPATSKTNPETRTKDGPLLHFDNKAVNPGDKIELSLDRLDTVQFQAVGADLSGTRIRSSKPIAVFSGNAKTAVGQEFRVFPTESTVVTSLAPLSTWGRVFASVTTPAAHNYVKVTSALAGNEIEVVDQTLFKRRYNFTEAGNSEVIELPVDSPVIIRAVKPVQAVQFTFSGDAQIAGSTGPAMMNLVPAEQWHDYYAFSVPGDGTASNSGGSSVPANPAVPAKSGFRHFLTLVAKRSDVGGIMIDHSSLETQMHPSWFKIPDSDYVAARVELKPGTSHVLYHENPIRTFFATLYSASGHESYSTAIGCRLTPLPVNKESCQHSQMITGDLMDNDCDQLVDEELCNGIDDDLDNEIDEDCALEKFRPAGGATSGGVGASVGGEGPRGPSGPSGPAGEPGPRGPPGPQGPEGPFGPPGPPGEPGGLGPVGPFGDKGDQGLIGVQGPPGGSGIKGYVGFLGDKGTKGELGERGQPGWGGPKGDRGDPGPPGKQGDVGVPGDNGPKGDRGVPGERGLPGGLHKSQCNTGFYWDNRDSLCRDLDECQTSNGGCQYTCTNTEGSFECSCPKGFTISPDKLTCIEINECSGSDPFSATPKPKPCGGWGVLCLNTLGSYACVNTTDMTVIGRSGGVSTSSSASGTSGTNAGTNSATSADSQNAAYSAQSSSSNVLVETNLVSDKTLIGLFVWLVIISLVVVVGLILVLVWAIHHNKSDEEEQKFYAAATMTAGSPPGTPNQLQRTSYVAYTAPPQR